MSRPKVKLSKSKVSSKAKKPEKSLESGSLMNTAQELDEVAENLAVLLACFSAGLRPDLDVDAVEDFIYRSILGKSWMSPDEIYHLGTQVSLAPLDGDKANQ